MLAGPYTVAVSQRQWPLHVSIDLSIDPSIYIYVSICQVSLFTVLIHLSVSSCLHLFNSKYLSNSNFYIYISRTSINLSISTYLPLVCIYQFPYVRTERKLSVAPTSRAHHRRHRRRRLLPPLPVPGADETRLHNPSEVLLNRNRKTYIRT